MRFKKQKKLLGRAMAIRLQTYWRMYRLKHTHWKEIERRRIIVRLWNCMKIQCCMRMKLGCLRVARHRAQRMHAIVTLQRIYRGAIVRLWRLRQKAARRLQKSFKNLKSRAFFRCVMNVVQLQCIFKARYVLIVFFDFM